MTHMQGVSEPSEGMLSNKQRFNSICLAPPELALKGL